MVFKLVTMHVGNGHVSFAVELAFYCLLLIVEETQELAVGNN